MEPTPPTGTPAAASPGLGPGLPQLWSEGFLVVQLVAAMRKRIWEERLAARPSPRRLLWREVDRPSSSRRIDGASQQRNEEIFPLPQLRDLSALSSGGVIRLDAW